ncbi:MAG: hypothetical protein AAGD04_09735 [Pseudomonadota bacterium]
MTFFSFQPPPGIIGVLLAALYAGPYLLPIYRGRADWLARALMVQLAIMAGLCLVSFLFTERGPDLGGVVLFCLLFLPFMALAAGLIALRNRFAKMLSKSD